MARKSKVRIDRVIILILAAILVFGALGFGLYKVFGLLFNDNNSNNEVIPNVETTDGINVSLVDYTVYVDDTNQLGFNFIIAKLKFVGIEPVKFDLGSLQTSEKKYLNDVNTYIQLLQEKGYKLDELEISRVIDSTENTVEANIFIPYTTDAGNLQVYNAKNPSTSLNFDLEQNNKIVTSLKFESENNIVINNASIRVSSSFVSTIMIHNGKEYDIPSSQKVFTFKIFVDSIDENVSIVDAYFIKDGDDEKIQCLSDEYESAKVDNIIGKKLVPGENGALFFETYSMDNEPDYAGILMIKFSNSNDWVKLSTSLE